MSYQAYPNNYYNPYTFQQPYYQPQPQVTQVTPMNQMSGIQWVQGKTAAQAFNVPPGQTMLLMDSETPTLYLKSTDVSGRPAPMVVYDLVERKDEPKSATQSQPEINLSEYVKRTEIEELIDKRIGELQFTGTCSKRKGVEE